MALNTNAPGGTTMADLPLEYLSLYHAVDTHLSSIFIFYGPVATANATVSSSRIQAHIFTPAGFQSYSRITISPAAPLYAAVNHLPRDKQGDPITRGLAVSMLKYFAELSEPVRKQLTASARMGLRQGERPPRLFDDVHAAELANNMKLVENPSEIVRDVRSACQERRIPWVDMDVVLPAGLIHCPQRRGSAGSDIEMTQSLDYGPYTQLIEALGQPMFLPTSRLKRAPSQPTNVSKSRIFSRSQKEALRLTMCEFVDTEERYVAKVYTLVHEVAEEFRQKAQRREPTSLSPDEKALEALFPPSLNEILDINLGFLDVIRNILEETEKDALEDISQDTELPASKAHRSSSRDGKDAIGATKFARELLEWLPRFSAPYADYMRAHNGFTQTLNSFMRDKTSSFSRRVHETGEQRLRSLLMEPVQRLPRYSLLIDTMTGSLPLVHPAVRPLLKARDIVKDICALDNGSPSSHVQSLRRLREIVDGWSGKSFPEGRLITAVDVNEITPPYNLESRTSAPAAGIMLLYKNCLVLISKSVGSRVTARGLLADIDDAASSNGETPTSIPSADLKVAQVFEIHSVRCMQSGCGRLLYIIPTTHSPSAASPKGSDDVVALELTALYEGKVGKLIEEITKARIEGRFPEQQREGGKWTLRSPPSPANNTGILACVYENGQSVALEQGPAPFIRMLFDTPKAEWAETLQASNADVVMSINSSDNEQFRLDIDSVIGSPSTDLVTVDTFVPTLLRRLHSLLVPLNGARNTKLMKPLISSNYEILRYIAGALVMQVKSSRSFRPPSPTKLISNFLGGSRETVPTVKHPSSATLLGEFPKMSPQRINLSRSNTLPSAFPGKDNCKEKQPEKDKDKESSRISMVEVSGARGPDGQLRSLEQTFAAYILSLQSRSGNILGRMLRNREHADRALVNELYNILLEDPSKLQAAAEVPVDTLFVAFETFMRNAWRENMGPIIDSTALKNLQKHFDNMFPRDFEEQFRKFLVNTNPQNCRALAAITRLLAELLDASGNDGDRGALTVAFAEVLTEDGDPVQHVSLLDRLVDYFDNLFEELIPYGSSVEGALNFDRSKSPQTSKGSVSSNSSSFRRRFGFNLHKDSSKAEGESKMASILRTLSKKSSPGESDPNIPRGSLLRSKSTDVDSRLGFLRPTSRERPYGFSSEEQISRPGTGQGQPPSLSSLRGISHDGAVKLRRRRRSSLSDFRPDTASSDTSHVSSIAHLRPATPSNRPRTESITPASQPRPHSSYLTSSSRPTSPTKAPSPGRLGSPIRQTSPTRPATPSRKENVDPKVPQRERSTQSKFQHAGSPPQESKRRSRATSIPQRTPALRERAPANGTEVRRPQSSSSSQRPPKLRMQSPQKLRERVQAEKHNQAIGQASFHNELQALGDEIVHFELPMGHDAEDTVDTPRERRSPDTKPHLQSRFKRLEQRFNSIAGEYNDRTSALERDLESSLVVSEKRVKKLDELYREASAENEALYDRFNAELSKIAKDVRSGSAEDVLKDQLSNALEEISRLKKENFRLKREVGGLRAQSAAVALLRASEQ